MPSFFSRAYPQSSPLTPSDQKSSYVSNFGGVQITTQMPYVPHPTANARHEKRTYEVPETFGQQAAFTAPMPYQQQPMQQATYNGFPPPGLTHPNQAYGALMPQILPPIRAHEHPAFETAVLSHPQIPPAPTTHAEVAKDEKAVGGVATHLDYEMDQMSDYVSEMAQGMYDLYASKICLADIDMIRSVQPSSPVSPAFRKFVSQILSSTRLPSSTILLGLYYLGTRMGMLSANGQYKASSGQVYRMLTIALLLGSKFLDDNTFQNRSWSEVTGLAVSELNTLEVEWLVAIEWNLHVDPHEQHGVMTWRDHWQAWKGKAVERSANALKLLPIDTSVQRPGQVKGYSPAPLYPPRYSKTAAPSFASDRPQTHYQVPVHYDPSAWAYPRSTTDRSPPSAPETGPTTPEYYSGWPMNAPPPYSMRQRFQYTSQPPPYHQTPYVQPYSQNIWNSHGAGCGCHYCLRPNEPYFAGAGYAPQTVMG